MSESRISIITYWLLGYGDRSFQQDIKIPLNTDRASNTEIIGFQDSTESTTIDQTHANRSIIPTGYKDAPQWRSIEPQTLKLLGFEVQPTAYASSRIATSKII